MGVVAGHAEHGRDLGDIEPLAQLQLDQVLFSRVQAAHRRAKQPPQIVPLGFAADVGRGIGHVGHVIQRRRDLDRAGTQASVALVAGHGI